MKLTDALVVKFVRWWCLQDESEWGALLSEKFAFDGGLQPLDKKDFLSARATAGEMTELILLDLHSCESHASVMFEANDSVTGLRHRVAWLISADDQGVVRVSSCSAQALNAQDKRAFGIS